MSKTSISRNIPWAFLFFFFVILILNTTLVAPYLLALFLGWVLATVLHPLQKKLIKKKFKPKWAALLSTLIATFTIIFPVGGFGFATVKSLITVITPYTKQEFSLDTWVERVQHLSIVNRFFDNADDLKHFMNNGFKSGADKAMKLLSGILAGAPEFGLQLILSLLMCYFLLAEGEKLQKWLGARIPLPAKTRAELARSLSDTAYSSFLSMLAAAFTQALVVLTGFLVLKVPMAMLAFGLAFIFAWIPIFGVTPVWLGGLIYLIANDHVGAAIGMGIFGLVASLSDNVVRPWVIKDRSDLHPLVSLVAIFGSIQFFGLAGVLVGPVLAACLIEFLNLWPKFAGDLGLDPDGP